MISIILTIHDKDFILEKIINGLLNTVSENVKEYIFVLDGCSDNSLHIVKQMINDIKVKSIIIETPDVYETRANNAGLKIATQPYVIIVQDDQLLMEKNWDTRLLRPFLEFNDIFAITARTSCSMDIYGNWVDIIEGPVGYNYGKSSNTSRNHVYIGQVVNRGPLMIHSEKLKILGYFDETMPGLQGCDDANLCLKAYIEYNWRCGCYWIGYNSPLEWGSTRVGKNIEKLEKDNSINEKEFLKRYYNIIKSWSSNEIRFLEDIS